MAMNSEKLTVNLGVAVPGTTVTEYAKALKREGYTVERSSSAGTIKAMVPQDGGPMAGKVVMRGFQHRYGLWHLKGDPAVFTPKAEEPSNG